MGREGLGSLSGRNAMWRETEAGKVMESVGWGPESPVFCSGRQFIHSLSTAKRTLSPTERASSVGIFWVVSAPVLGETVPGRVPACLAGLTCVSLPSPGLTKTYRSHGPAPLHRNCPSSAASCPDHRHHVCTKEAEEKENLLYLPTENQYERTNKPRVLWQSMN